MARVNIDILTDTHGSETKLDKVKGALGGMEGGADTAKNALGGMFLKMAAGLLTIAAVKKAFDFLSGSITAASDSQETYSKFGTIFNTVLREANKEAGNLADNYGLSETASREMLSATGDLLTGVGATAGAALDLSVKTQQLAVDLASFTNYSGGAKGASDALTKAMLGERESLKSLGIVVSEEMVKTKLAEQGKSKLTGAALLQAKAYITLEIATEQSKNALGDFERTSKDYANQQRILKGGLEDLNVELGKVFLPLMADVTRGTKEVVSGLKTWAAVNQDLLGSTGASIRVMGGQLKEIAISVLSLAGGIGGLSERLTTLYMNYTGLRTPQQQLRAEFADATKKAFEWQGSLKHVNVSMEDLKKNYIANAKDGGEWARGVKDLDDKLRGQAESSEVLEENLRKVDEQYQGHIENYKKLHPALSTYTELTDTAAIAVDGILAKTSEWRVELLDFPTLMDGAALAVENWATRSFEAITNTALPAARDFNDLLPVIGTNFGDLAEDGETSAKDIASAWGTMTDGLKTKWASAIGDVILKGGDLRDFLGGMWGALKGQIADMIGAMVVDFVAGMLTMKIAAEVTAAATVGVGTAAAATAPVVGASFAAMLAPIAVVAAAIIAVLGVFYLIIKALEKIFGWKGTGVPWVAPPLVPPGKDDNKGTVPLESTGVGSLKGPGFASGGAFIPSGATPIMVHPRELVDITPLSELRSSGRSRAGMGFDGEGGGGTQAIYLDGQRVGEILASHITQLIRQGKIQIDMQSLIVSEG